ncbi:hexokinase [Treponema sp. TIM-1]|uniref:hexokinase n=1 Tax=Treponema sp. TIM-1 TaxID=2898417 RepID=UPI003980E6ED
MASFNPGLLAEFARHYGFHYDLCDPRVLIRDALTDMERGLKGQSSNLPMIPAYISPITRVPPGKTVIALDAGGTNLRAALVCFDDQGKAQPENSRKVPMPGTKGRVDAETFFNEIAGLIIPLFEEARSAGKTIEGVGFCFSYPMDITANSDGTLLAFSKEVDAPDVIGKAIGQGLRDALIRRGTKPPERIVLLNDTVAALLSGLAEIPPNGGKWRGADLYGKTGGPVIGLILGTGFNIAYPEKNIPKIGFASESSPQIVVCEAGTFHPRYLGILDREYDATTKNPGVYTMEKSNAGAYLGPLTHHILKQAIRDGVLRFKKSEEFLSWPALQTKDLNAFMYAPLAGEGPLGELFGPDEEDALTSLVYLTSIVTERAALFSAAVVAAAVERTGSGYDPFVPVRIAVEGTTYVIYKGMREALESYLHAILFSPVPRSYVIAPVEQASLFGAAVAALH